MENAACLSSKPHFGTWLTLTPTTVILYWCQQRHQPWLAPHASDSETPAAWECSGFNTCLSLGETLCSQAKDSNEGQEGRHVLSPREASVGHICCGVLLRSRGDRSWWNWVLLIHSFQSGKNCFSVIKSFGMKISIEARRELGHYWPRMKDQAWSGSCLGKVLEEFSFISVAEASAQIYWRKKKKGAEQSQAIDDHWSSLTSRNPSREDVHWVPIV